MSEAQTTTITMTAHQFSQFMATVPPGAKKEFSEGRVRVLAKRKADGQTVTVIDAVKDAGLWKVTAPEQLILTVRK